MRKNNWGRIINISSVAANHGILSLSNYSSSKGALKSFTISSARELGPFGVRVNCISPGGLEGAIKGKLIKQNSNFKKKYLKKVPLKRFCNPNDIAEMCLFLSNSKSSYVTGQNLILDGGLSII